MARMTNFRSAAIATGNQINDSAYDNVKIVADNIGIVSRNIIIVNDLNGLEADGVVPKDNGSSIDRVSANMKDVNTLASIGNLANIATVANDLRAIDANLIADITIVADDLNLVGVSNVLDYGSISEDIEISSVGSSMIETVSYNIDDVITVATGLNNNTVNVSAQALVDIDALQESDTFIEEDIVTLQTNVETLQNNNVLLNTDFTLDLGGL